MADQHPSIAHLLKAAELLARAGDRAREAAAHYERAEHQTAANVAGRVYGLMAEATGHLRVAERRAEEHGPAADVADVADVSPSERAGGG